MKVEPVDAYDRFSTESGFLHLSMRRLYHVPKGVLRQPSPCCNIVRLDLSFNHLRTLPEAIANLSKLEELWLNDNPLESLPEGLAQCKRLRVLDCAHTTITSLPDKLGTLQCVQKVNLDGVRTLLTPLDCAYAEKGTKGVMQYLQWSNEDAALKTKFESELSEGIYRVVAESDDLARRRRIPDLVAEIFKTFPEHADIKSLMRNHKRLFPDKIERVDLRKVRNTFESLRKENLRKKYAASLELKLRAIYFDRIDPTMVEGIVKSIYAEIRSLEDVVFLMKHATKLFPKEVSNLNTAKLFKDLQVLRDRLAEERASAVSMVVSALHSLYSHVEPERCQELAEAVIKRMKKAEDIKKLAADALGYFPAEFEAAKEQANEIGNTFLESLSNEQGPATTGTAVAPEE